MATLAINKCPAHGFTSISIDTESGGIRVTPGKCCGRWEVVKEWELTSEQWKELSIEADNASRETPLPEDEGKSYRKP